MRGRFFERLEERAECLPGQHVHLVDDVDLELRRGWRVFHGVAQLADFFDPAIARAVDFNHVQRAAFSNFTTTRIVVGKIHFGAAGAVEALGKDAGDGGFAGAARAAEQVGVGGPVLPDGVGEGLGDVVLADHIVEPLRPILSRYDLIGHL